MKKLLPILLLIGVLNCNAQTDYRDNLTGYYHCTTHDTLYMYDGWTGTSSFTVTKIGLEADSMMNFYENSSHNYNCHVRLNYSFYGNSSDEFMGSASTTGSSFSAWHSYTFGPVNQPGATHYLCSKTGPLALDENIKPKITIAQSIGAITITQPELIIDRLKLYSIEGKELLNETLYSTSNTVNTSGIPTGIYLLAFYKNNQFIDSKKVIISH